MKISGEQGGYPRSWYAASCTLPAPRARLDGTVSCEVCVIGGGLAGLTLRPRTWRAGRDVLLLEANRIGWGASGSNGGFVSAGFAESLTNIMRARRPCRSQALFKLSVEGAEYVRARDRRARFRRIQHGRGLARRLALCRYGWPAALRRDARTATSAIRLKLLATAETRSFSRSERYFDSRLDPRAFHIHPLALLPGAGGSRRTCRSPPFRGHPRSGTWRRQGVRATSVVTAQGSITTQTCGLLPQSSHDPHLSRALARRHAAGGHLCRRYRALGRACSAAIATRAAVADTRRAGNYYRLITDDRLFWGGKITTRVTEPGRLAEVMKKDMLSTLSAARQSEHGVRLERPHGLCPPQDAYHRRDRARPLGGERLWRPRSQHDGHGRPSHRPRHC